MINKTVYFENVNDFSLDTGLEISTDVLKTTLLTYPNETLCAPFRFDANFLRGSAVAGELVNGASITSSKLDLTGAGIRYFEADLNGSVNTFANIFTVRLKYTPSYSGAPAATYTLFSMKNIDTSLPNVGQLDHKTSGSVLSMTMRNGSGTSFFTMEAAFSPVAGTEYEIEVNIDVTSGASRLFVNGSQIATSSSTGTRATPTGQLRIGTDTSAGTGNNIGGKFRDLQVFSTVQHVSNFTGEIPRAFPSNYTLGELKAVSLDTTTTDMIDSYYDTGNFNVLVVVDGSYKYFDGADWVDSDGTFAQSNTSSVLTANISNLDISNGSVVSFVFIINSDGITYYSMEQFTVNYSYWGGISTEIPRCTVFVQGTNLFDNSPDVTNAKLIASITKAFVHTGKIVFDELNEEALFNQEGYAELELIETETVGKKVNFSIQYDINGETKTITFKPLVIPNDSGANLAEIGVIQ